MEFAFDDHQLEFREQLASFLRIECDGAALRQAWSSDIGWSPKRWRLLADMGVVGITVPERFGGLGLGLVDLILLIEEAGRAALPEPIVETTALGVPLLSDLVLERGPSGERAFSRELADSLSGWLLRVAAGEAVIAVGTAEEDHVVAAQGADGFLLAQRPSDERDGQLELHLVPATQVEVTPSPVLDGAHRLGTVRWSPSPGTLIASGSVAERLVRATGDRAATATAAMLVGLAEAMIAMASSYAKERTQFGKQIGSFQAVKHLLANALVRVEFAKPLVYRSAWSVDSQSPLSSLHASMAKAQASDAAVLAARTALQVHGAIGYTWEHDLHMFMKRTWALASSWGDPAYHRMRALQILSASHSASAP